MSAVESLPGDQRAVLQLVLGRRRSYEEIARMLSFDPSAVRERALAALDSLGPQTKIDQPSRAMICDYLLGQLTEDDAEAVRDHLARSAGERAWASVVSSELTPLACEPLPEIPREASPGRGAPRSSSSSDDSSAGPRSSRLGGLIVIGVVVAIVVVGLVVALSSGSSKKKKTNTLASTPTPVASTSTTSSASAAVPATTTASTPPAAKVVAQINLTPPAAGSSAAGIAEVLREGSTNGIAIVAQNVPPNTTDPPNAYAVWLYNSSTDAKILGFVNPGVPKSGKLSTAGGLPANAAHYKELIVTVESSANPKAPGTVILQGTLTGV
jgi:hypothetical protein